MYKLTIKKNEEKKTNFYHFNDGNEEIVKKARPCAQIFIRKVGLENIEFDLTDSKHVTLYNTVSDVKIEVPARKKVEKKSTKKIEEKIEEVEHVDVESKSEVADDGKIEETFVTDDGDVVTIVH